MSVCKKFKQGESDVVGVANLHRAINEVMAYWIEIRMVKNTVNMKNKVMNRDKNWFAGERIIGSNSKRVEFFVRV